MLSKSDNQTGRAAREPDNIFCPDIARWCKPNSRSDRRLGCGVPTLDVIGGRFARRQLVIALDPFRLDDVAAGRNRVLLVLGGKYMRPYFVSTRFEKVERCAFGIQRVTNTARVKLVRADLDSLLLLGDGRKLEQIPRVGRLAQQGSGQIVDHGAVASPG